MNIYVIETVIEVVQKLREKGFRVDYKPNSNDPESPNGYVVPEDKPWNIIATISSVIRWRKVMPKWDLPDKSKACFQFADQKTAEKTELIKTIKNSFTILREE